jgi:hypothetical protein
MAVHRSIFPHLDSKIGQRETCPTLKNTLPPCFPLPPHQTLEKASKYHGVSASRDQAMSLYRIPRTEVRARKAAPEKVVDIYNTKGAAADPVRTIKRLSATTKPQRSCQRSREYSREYSRECNLCDCYPSKRDSGKRCPSEFM